MQDIHHLLKIFSEQADTYRVKEIGDGTHDFTKKVLEWIFGLAPKSSLVPETNLFGESLYDNFYVYEWSKKQWANARWDFRCKINGKLVVVETEKLDNIEAGMKQIGGYMRAEQTPYGIVTDGGIWRFFKDGADNLDKYETKSITQLCWDDGAAFLQNFYNSYEFYLDRLLNVESIPFDIQKFHQRLITTAERLVFDLRHIWLFTGDNKEIEKEEIQTSYSLIIQLLLIKIVQDKKNIELLKKEVIVEQLKWENRTGIFEAVEEQINRLGKFYQPYHNQQDSLLDKIIKHYQGESRVAKLNLDSIRLFLDLYYFIYSFDFKKVKQDLFGAVYENYLKELYKEEDSKKWQVFTPPEIVEFMLDEVGYTVDYIQEVIHRNLPSLKENLDNQHYNINGLSLIDPACGSGTFLYKSAWRIVHALHNIRKTDNITNEQAGKMAEILICNNIVGFDIEPFPLYLAEMNILQRLLFFNVWEDGEILNRIESQIKIFSTDDSIKEFDNLDQSMKHDLTSMASSMNLFSKRNNEAIFGIKADIQERDPQYFINTIQLEKWWEEIQKPVYMFQDTTLLTKQNKSFWEKYSKLMQKKCSTFAELKAFIKASDEKIYEAFIKNLKKYDTFFQELDKKLKELKVKTITKRTKFDFVVANPPYVRSVAFHDNNNLYGININDKKYTKIYMDWGDEMRIGNSKFNIYGYFYYLGFFLLKDWGKMSFINPRTFLFQPSFHKLRQFIKYNFSLHKLIDFNNGIVFYDRGVNGKIEVITDACITLITKSPQESSHQVDVIKYTGEERLVNLAIFKDNNSGIIKKNISEIVDYNGYRFFHYFNELKTKDPDFHFSIYSRINQSQINYDKIGLPIIKPQGYYAPRANNLWYFDYENIGAMETYPTCELIIEKKYKISRGSLTMLWSIETKKKHGIDFVYTDYEWLNQRDRFTSLGVSNKKNIPELYYLFGMFNSYSCQKQFIEDFGTNVNKTNLSLLKFPLLNTPEKLQLKLNLISNSESIINLCKNGNVEWPQTRWEICETAFDPDTLWEKIIDIKKQYSHLWISLNSTVSPMDFLPEDVIVLFQNEISDLKKLEFERDEIVKKLYDLE